MRYMLDTNIFLFMAIDRNRLSDHVRDILYDWNDTLCMSMESVREIIIKQRNHDFDGHRWATADALLRDITDTFQIDILPVDLNVLRTLFSLRLNTEQEHNDPFDHIIISHAITCRLPLISSDGKFPFYRQQGLRLVENI
jgi:PIN domain nuclease of toxin-antitoxin system